MKRSTYSCVITIAVCTLNRPTLRATVESLIAQRLDRRHFRILVVDDSPDLGARQISRIAPGNVSIDYAPSAALSLSRARNLAIERCCTPLLAYIDDDAIADPTWVESLIDCFEQSTGVVAAWGGPVHPVFEVERPLWLSHKLARYLAIIDWGPSERTVDDTIFLVGANIAFRTGVLREVGGFRTELGRQRGLLLSSEDVEIRRRINALGYEFSYSPRPIVRHRVQASRLTPEWFLRRAFWQGVSDGVAAAPAGELRRADEEVLGACFDQEMNCLDGSIDEPEPLMACIVNFKKSGRACVESCFASHAPMS